MKDFFGAAAIMAFFVVLFAALSFAISGSNLLFEPFRVHQETHIFRNGDGYITAQQQMLREYRRDYDAAGPAQQRAILRQMQETADLIKADVQPDIAAFLASHAH